MQDNYNRSINYLRLSLTDRCQLRCTYCLPEDGVEWTPTDQLLNFEEIKALVQGFANLGVVKVKLTGGEPLLRPDLIPLIKALKEISGIEEVTLTTNGVRLEPLVDELVAAGLDGVNISLDTLDAKRYCLLTGQDQLMAVLKGIEVATKKIKQVKINCVIIEEINGDEIWPLAQLAKKYPVHVRFIEFMPLGAQKGLKGVSTEAIKKVLYQSGGSLKKVNKTLGNGPAQYYNLQDFQGSIGFISAMSNHFCQSCNRVRVTSEGMLKTCLYFKGEVDLRAAMKENRLEAQILEALVKKPKEHQFNRQQDDKEQKSMIQIGG